MDGEMLIDSIHTNSAPRAIGPYSQAIRSGCMVYAAGQMGMDPVTGKIVPGGIACQTHRAIANLQSVLEAAGSGLGHVLKTTVFITDMGKFAEMNTVYSEYFSQQPPARSAVQVSALPREGAEVEIECIAIVKGSGGI